jgi:hypothetical protein
VIEPTGYDEAEPPSDAWDHFAVIIHPAALGALAIAKAIRKADGMLFIAQGCDRNDAVSKLQQWADAPLKPPTMDPNDYLIWEEYLAYAKRISEQQTIIGA